MASPRKHCPLPQLRRLLEDQQEPFLLELYLIQNGYLHRKGFNSEVRYKCPPTDSCMNLQRLMSVCRSLRTTKESILPRCSRVLKSLLFLHKLNHEKNGKASSHDHREVYAINIPRFRNSSSFPCAAKETPFSELNQYFATSKESLSIPDQNAGRSFSSIDGLCDMKLYNLEEQVSSDKTFQWGCMEEYCKQYLSPVSVLKLPSDHEASPQHNNNQPCKRTYQEEYSILSASQREFLVYTIKEEMGFEASKSQELQGSICTKNKTVLKQMEQLLLDYVREVVESHVRRKGRCRSTSHTFIEPSILRKIICEQISSWGNHGAACIATNSLHQLSKYSSVECRDVDSGAQIKEIGVEIGDAIFEERIDELVSEMYGCPSAWYRCLKSEKILDY